MSSSQRISITGMFIALGILFPMLFHLTGGPGLGRIFLPMHLPVLLAGFLGGPVVGLTTGVLAPGLSSLVTGMPPAPIPAIPMTFELVVYGGLAGILFRRQHRSLMLSLIVAMLGGRIVYALLFAYILPLFGWEGAPLYAWLTGTVLPSWPGIAIQLVAVPLIVSAARHMPIFAEAKADIDSSVSPSKR